MHPLHAVHRRLRRGDGEDRQTAASSATPRRRPSAVTRPAACTSAGGVRRCPDGHRLGVRDRSAQPIAAGRADPVSAACPTPPRRRETPTTCIRLVNQGDTPATFTVGLEDHDGLRSSTDAPSVLLRPGEMKSVLATITARRSRSLSGDTRSAREDHRRQQRDSPSGIQTGRPVHPTGRAASDFDSSLGGAPTPADSGVKP